MERIREAAHEVQRPVFYAIAIIITAYLPIFTLQRVEGKLFKPMAWTVAFALLGALIFSMLVAPALASLLFRSGVKEWKNPVMGYLTAHYRKAVTWAIRHRAYHGGGRGAFCLHLRCSWAFSGVIGSEFLPHLDEGAIWVRGTLAPSTGPTESARVAERARQVLCSFPEVPQVVNQIGRPDDGTDTTGFFDMEFFVDLLPKEKWRPVFHQDKDSADRRDGPRTGEDTGSILGILSADFGQPGRGRERRERRAGGENLWRRSEDAGRKRG